jgi:glycerol-3-phosphate dehydrogenase
VVLNAMDAEARGAQISTRTRCTALQRHATHWLADLRDESTGDRFQVNARALITEDEIA